MIEFSNYLIIMKLLFDQGLPRGAVSLFQAAQIDAVHVGELGYAAAADQQILELARREGRVEVTLDADFHDALAATSSITPSVIRIRIERLKAQGLADLLIPILPNISADLDAGALIVIQVGRVRVRRLPLL